jgi:hypothetical protein
VYDPSVNQTAKSYFTTKVNKSQSSHGQNWTAVSSIMLQTVVTSKHEYCNLMFTNYKKEDGIYTLKRDSKAQDKDQRSIVTIYKSSYKGVVFSTY